MADTTALSVPTPVHLVLVRGDDHEYRAACCCGWVSEWHPSSVEAGVAGSEHRDAAAGPPDAMDGAMSAMLDLQVDLAEVVVWLAENWSSELPSPYVHGTDRSGLDEEGHPAGVRLVMPCLDAEILARPAERLGVPVRLDAGSASQGHGYARAIRRFGRVEIDAHT